MNSVTGRTRPDAHWILRAVLVLATYALATLALPTSAGAHSEGKAIPKIDVTVTPDASSVTVQTVTVHISDLDSGTPVTGADVVAEGKMLEPHEMSTLPTTLQPTGDPGTYAANMRFPMAAEWTLAVHVSGSSVQTADKETSFRVSLTTATPAAGPGDLTSTPPPGGGLTPTVTGSTVRIRGSLSWRDAIPIATLAVHSISALAWVGLTLLLVLAAYPTRKRWMTDEFSERVLAKRSKWRLGAIAAGSLLVLTGLINGLVAAPFRLTPTPGAISNGLKIPFGGLYMAILATKIVILVILVFVNRISVNEDEDRADAAKFALRADAVLLPILLLAIVMLRYVHILSHLAQAVS